MSGQFPNRVTVKLNGEKIERPARPKVTISSPAPIAGNGKKEASLLHPGAIPHHGTKEKEEDAFERLLQLRGTTDQANRRATQNDVTEPGEELLDETAVESPFRIRRTWMQTPALKTLMTAGSAVSIGLLFGFLVLTVFTQEQLSHSYRSVLTGTMQSLTAQELGQRSTAGQNLNGLAQPASLTPSNGQNVALQLPEQRFFMAQAGAFQLDASEEAAIAPFEKLGIPHLLYRGDDKQYVFAAAAPTRDGILGFASSLKAKGTEVYVKEIAFPGLQKKVAVSQAAGSAQAPDLNTFFLNGLEMARALAAQSASVVTSAANAPGGAEATALKEKHRRFLEESRAVQAPEDWKPLFDGMVNGMNQAMTAQAKMQEALAGKKAANAENYAWQVQAGVLTYLENYTKWVQMVK